MGRVGDFFTSRLLVWALGCILVVHGCGLLIRVTDRRFSRRARAVGRAGAGVISVIILVAGVVSYAVDFNSALTLLIRLDVQRLTMAISAGLALLTFNITISYLLSTMIVGLFLDSDS